MASSQSHRVLWPDGVLSGGTRTCAHTRVHTHVHTRTCTHTCAHTHAHTPMHAHTHTPTHACTHAHTHTMGLILQIVQFIFMLRFGCWTWLNHLSPLRLVSGGLMSRKYVKSRGLTGLWSFILITFLYKYPASPQPPDSQITEHEGRSIQSPCFPVNRSVIQRRKASCSQFQHSGWQGHERTPGPCLQIRLLPDIPPLSPRAHLLLGSPSEQSAYGSLISHKYSLNKPTLLWVVSVRRNYYCHNINFLKKIRSGHTM